ncbi:MAG: DUF885 domain-containing protein, partial [Nonomuraea sp.]|nr:DUF885 domain-containing protein [Nonomuraea sp.]
MSSTLTELAEEFWSWRAATQPVTSDDIVRVERPPGWVNDWSPGAVEARRRDLAAFAERYQRLDLAAEPVAVQVDGRLIGSALARVRYELELLRGWQRDPGFYLQQSLGPLFEVLLVPPPLDEGRVADVLRHLGQVPVVLEHARQHLEGHAVAAFARYAGLLVDRAVKELDRAMRALAPLLPAVPAEALLSLTGRAVAALAAYGEWLGERTAGFAQDVSAGPEVLGFFLHRVALCPDPADRLRAQARQEYGRAVALEQLLRARHRGAAPQPMIAGVEQEERDEAAIRAF